MPQVLVINGRGEYRRKWIEDCTLEELDDAIEVRQQGIKADKHQLEQMRRASALMHKTIGSNDRIGDYMRYVESR